MPDRVLRTKLDGPGLYLFEVAGRNHYQPAILQLLRDRFEESAALQSTAEYAEYYANATLRSEPTNPHDCNAIAVEISGLKVGYLDRHTAAKLTKQCKRLDIDPDYSVVGSNLKFWINPSRLNHVLIYPPYDTHYGQPRTTLGSVPPKYVLPIVRNITTRGTYSARSSRNVWDKRPTVSAVS